MGLLENGLRGPNVPRFIMTFRNLKLLIGAYLVAPIDFSEETRATKQLNQLYIDSWHAHQCIPINITI